MSLAQFKVEISGVGISQIPIGIANFRGVEAAPQNISRIVVADLERSGQFKQIESGVTLDENTRPDFVELKTLNIDAMVTGSISKLADGRYDVRYRLWDTVRQQDLGGQSFMAFTPDLRLVAHRIADQVYEKLTGHFFDPNHLRHQARPSLHALGR
jgi:TolB protein